MKTVAYHNLGCKVNAYEMDAMLQALRQKGYEIVPFEEKADIYIINTCTVTNIADRKSRQMLHKAKKTNPEGIVVAVGCYVQSDTQAVQADKSVDLIIGNNRKKDLISILEKYFDGVAQESVIDINHTLEYEEMKLTATQEHTRAYIKIQDGCNQFCSYCIIPYARGRVRSRREEDILREVRGMAESGYREIVLTGIHISSYGTDRGGSELLLLLKKLSDIEGIERIRLGSLEPGIVTDHFAGQISALPKVCPHFHLSLQSGSDTVLRRMNRRYDTAAYYGAVELLRKYYINPAITTDVIVGFPGETEEEFLQTEVFLRRVGFYEMHIFKYSRRQGTRAADMEGQLTEAEKAVRSDILMRLEREMSHAYRESFLGKTQEVLFEETMEKAGKTYWIGHTPNYIKAAKEVKPEEELQNRAPGLRNRVLQCRLEAFLETDIMLAVEAAL